DDIGGAIAAVEASYMKQRLVESNAARLRKIETGELTVVGVNKFLETEPSPLAAGTDGGIQTIPEWVEREQVESLKAWRAARDNRAAEATLNELRAAAQEGRNIMEPSIACAKAGVTTGEWAGILRQVFGEYRAPTGVSRAAVQSGGEGLAEV